VLDKSGSQAERRAVNDSELRELVASLAVSQKQTDKQLKELGKQIGGLGNNFGTFAEGLAYGSIRKILRDVFGMETVSPAFEIKKGGKSEEYDVLAYSNGEKNQGVVVEVKSLLDQRAIAQMRRKMEDLFEWLPEHRNKEFIGMVVFVHADHAAREAVLAEGWHLVQVGDDLFKVQTPKGFQPRIYRAA
jgi:hypothetical protein